MIVLGLDISTNCTGFSVMGSDYSLIDCSYINTSSEKTWLNKALLFKNEIISKVCSKYDITHIGIEDILSKFSGGRSSSKVIISLARFNGIASYILFEHTHISPIHINVLRARKLAECQVPRKVNSKEFVFKRVREWYPKLEFPRKKKKIEEYDSPSYDMSDSIIISRALINGRKELINV